MSRFATAEAGTMGMSRFVHPFVYKANRADPANRGVALRTFRPTRPLPEPPVLVFLSDRRTNRRSLRSRVALLQDGLSRPLFKMHCRNDFARRRESRIHPNHESLRCSRRVDAFSWCRTQDRRLCPALRLRLSAGIPDRCLGSESDQAALFSATP